jgi:hypothetical protein
MKRKLIIGCITLGLFVGIVAATEKAVNLYKTHKIDANTVLVSCSEGLKLSVKQLNGDSLVLVSCSH